MIIQSRRRVVWELEHGAGEVAPDPVVWELDIPGEAAPDPVELRGEHGAAPAPAPARALVCLDLLLFIHPQI